MPRLRLFLERNNVRTKYINNCANMTVIIFSPRRDNKKKIISPKKFSRQQAIEAKISRFISD